MKISKPHIQFNKLYPASIYAPAAISPLFVGINQDVGYAQRNLTNTYKYTLQQMAASPFSVNSKSYMERIRDAYGYEDNGLYDALGTVGGVVGAGMGAYLSVGGWRGLREPSQPLKLLDPQTWRKGWQSPFQAPTGSQRGNIIRYNTLQMHRLDNARTIKNYYQPYINMKELTAQQLTSLLDNNPNAASIQKYIDLKIIDSADSADNITDVLKVIPEEDIIKANKIIDNTKTVNSVITPAAEAALKNADDVLTGAAKASKIVPYIGTAANILSVGLNALGAYQAAQENDILNAVLYGTAGALDIVSIVADYIPYVGFIISIAADALSLVLGAIAGWRVGETVGHSLTPEGAKAQALFAKNLYASMVNRPITTVATTLTTFAAPVAFNKLASLRSSIKPSAHTAWGNYVRSAATMYAVQGINALTTPLDEKITGVTEEEAQDVNFVSAFSLWGDINDNLFGATARKATLIGLVKGDPKAQKEALARAWGYSDDIYYSPMFADVIEGTKLAEIPVVSSVISVLGEILIDPRNAMEIKEQQIKNANIDALANGASTMYDILKARDITTKQIPDNDAYMHNFQTLFYEFEKTDTGYRPQTYQTVDPVTGTTQVHLRTTAFSQAMENPATRRIWLTQLAQAWVENGETGVRTKLAELTTEKIRGNINIHASTSELQSTAESLSNLFTAVTNRGVLTADGTTLHISQYADDLQARLSTMAGTEEYTDVYKYFSKTYHLQGEDEVNDKLIHKLIADFNLNITSLQATQLFQLSDRIKSFADLVDSASSAIITLANPTQKLIQKGAGRFIRYLSERSREWDSTQKQKQIISIKELKEKIKNNSANIPNIKEAYANAANRIKQQLTKEIQEKDYTDIANDISANVDTEYVTNTRNILKEQIEAIKKAQDEVNKLEADRVYRSYSYKNRGNTYTITLSTKEELTDALKFVEDIESQYGIDPSKSSLINKETLKQYKAYKYALSDYIYTTECKEILNELFSQLQSIYIIIDEPSSFINEHIIQTVAKLRNLKSIVNVYTRTTKQEYYTTRIETATIHIKDYEEKIAGLKDTPEDNTLRIQYERQIKKYNNTIDKAKKELNKVEEIQQKIEKLHQQQGDPKEISKYTEQLYMEGRQKTFSKDLFTQQQYNAYKDDASSILSDLYLLIGGTLDENGNSVLETGDAPLKQFNIQAIETGNINAVQLPFKYTFADVVMSSINKQFNSMYKDTIIINKEGPIYEHISKYDFAVWKKLSVQDKYDYIRTLYSLLLNYYTDDQISKVLVNHTKSQTVKKFEDIKNTLIRDSLLHIDGTIFNNTIKSGKCVIYKQLTDITEADITAYTIQSLLAHNSKITDTIKSTSTELARMWDNLNETIESEMFNNLDPTIKKIVLRTVQDMIDKTQSSLSSTPLYKYITEYSLPRQHKVNTYSKYKLFIRSGDLRKVLPTEAIYKEHEITDINTRISLIDNFFSSKVVQDAVQMNATYQEDLIERTDAQVQTQMTTSTEEQEAWAFQEEVNNLTETIHIEKDKYYNGTVPPKKNMQIVKNEYNTKKHINNIILSVLSTEGTYKFNQEGLYLTVSPTLFSVNGVSHKFSTLLKQNKKTAPGYKTELLEMMQALVSSKDYDIGIRVGNTFNKYTNAQVLADVYNSGKYKDKAATVYIHLNKKIKTATGKTISATSNRMKYYFAEALIRASYEHIKENNIQDDPKEFLINLAKTSPDSELLQTIYTRANTLYERDIAYKRGITSLPYINHYVNKLRAYEIKTIQNLFPYKTEVAVDAVLREFISNSKVQDSLHDIINLEKENPELTTYAGTALYNLTQNIVEDYKSKSQVSFDSFSHVSRQGSNIIFHTTDNKELTMLDLLFIYRFEPSSFNAFIKSILEKTQTTEIENIEYIQTQYEQTFNTYKEFITPNVFSLSYDVFKEAYKLDENGQEVPESELKNAYTFLNSNRELLNVLATLRTANETRDGKKAYEQLEHIAASNILKEFSDTYNAYNDAQTDTLYGLEKSKYNLQTFFTISLLNKYKNTKNKTEQYNIKYVLSNILFTDVQYSTGTATKQHIEKIQQIVLAHEKRLEAIKNSTNLTTNEKLVHELEIKQTIEQLKNQIDNITNTRSKLFKNYPFVLSDGSIEIDTFINYLTTLPAEQIATIYNSAKAFEDPDDYVYASVEGTDTLKLVPRKKAKDVSIGIPSFNTAIVHHLFPKVESTIKGVNTEASLYRRQSQLLKDFVKNPTDSCKYTTNAIHNDTSVKQFLDKTKDTEKINALTKIKVQSIETFRISDDSETRTYALIVVPDIIHAECLANKQYIAGAITNPVVTDGISLVTPRYEDNDLFILKQSDFDILISEWRTFKIPTEYKYTVSADDIADYDEIPVKNIQGSKALSYAYMSDLQNINTYALRTYNKETAFSQVVEAFKKYKTYQNKYHILNEAYHGGTTFLNSRTYKKLKAQAINHMVYSKFINTIYAACGDNINIELLSSHFYKYVNNDTIPELRNNNNIAMLQQQYNNKTLNDIIIEALNETRAYIKEQFPDTYKQYTFKYNDILTDEFLEAYSNVFNIVSVFYKNTPRLFDKIEKMAQKNKQEREHAPVRMWSDEVLEIFNIYKKLIPTKTHSTDVDIIKYIKAHSSELQTHTHILLNPIHNKYKQKRKIWRSRNDLYKYSRIDYNVTQNLVNAYEKLKATKDADTITVDDVYNLIKPTYLTNTTNIRDALQKIYDIQGKENFYEIVCNKILDPYIRNIRKQVLYIARTDEYKQREKDAISYVQTTGDILPIGLEFEISMQVQADPYLQVVQMEAHAQGLSEDIVKERYDEAYTQLYNELYEEHMQYYHANFDEKLFYKLVHEKTGEEYPTEEISKNKQRFKLNKALRYIIPYKNNADNYRKGDEQIYKEVLEHSTKADSIVSSVYRTIASEAETILDALEFHIIYPYTTNVETPVQEQIEDLYTYKNVQEYITYKCNALKENPKTIALYKNVLLTFWDYIRSHSQDSFRSYVGKKAEKDKYIKDNITTYHNIKDIIEKTKVSMKTARAIYNSSYYKAHTLYSTNEKILSNCNMKILDTDKEFWKVVKDKLLLQNNRKVYYILNELRLRQATTLTIGKEAILSKIQSCTNVHDFFQMLLQYNIKPKNLFPIVLYVNTLKEKYMLPTSGERLNMSDIYFKKEIQPYVDNTNTLIDLKKQGLFTYNRPKSIIKNIKEPINALNDILSTIKSINDDLSTTISTKDKPKIYDYNKAEYIVTTDTGLTQLQKQVSSKHSCEIFTNDQDRLRPLKTSVLIELREALNYELYDTLLEQQASSLNTIGSGSKVFQEVREVFDPLLGLLMPNRRKSDFIKVQQINTAIRSFDENDKTLSYYKQIYEQQYNICKKSDETIDDSKYIKAVVNMFNQSYYKTLNPAMVKAIIGYVWYNNYATNKNEFNTIKEKIDTQRKEHERYMQLKQHDIVPRVRKVFNNPALTLEEKNKEAALILYTKNYNELTSKEHKHIEDYINAEQLHNAGLNKADVEKYDTLEVAYYDKLSQLKKEGRYTFATKAILDYENALTQDADIDKKIATLEHEYKKIKGRMDKNPKEYNKPVKNATQIENEKQELKKLELELYEKVRKQNLEYIRKFFKENPGVFINTLLNGHRIVQKTIEEKNIELHSVYQRFDTDTQEVIQAWVKSELFYGSDLWKLYKKLEQDTLTPEDESSILLDYETIDIFKKSIEEARSIITKETKDKYQSKSKIILKDNTGRRIYLSTKGKNKILNQCKSLTKYVQSLKESQTKYDELMNADTEKMEELYNQAFDRKSDTLSSQYTPYERVIRASFKQIVESIKTKYAEESKALTNIVLDNKIPDDPITKTTLQQIQTRILKRITGIARYLKSQIKLTKTKLKDIIPNFYFIKGGKVNEDILVDPTSLNKIYDTIISYYDTESNYYTVYRYPTVELQERKPLSDIYKDIASTFKIPNVKKESTIKRHLHTLIRTRGEELKRYVTSLTNTEIKQSLMSHINELCDGYINAFTKHASILEQSKKDYIQAQQTFDLLTAPNLYTIASDRASAYNLPALCKDLGITDYETLTEMYNEYIENPLMFKYNSAQKKELQALKDTKESIEKEEILLKDITFINGYEQSYNQLLEEKINSNSRIKNTLSKAVTKYTEHLQISAETSNINACKSYYPELTKIVDDQKSENENFIDNLIQKFKQEHPNVPNLDSTIELNGGYTLHNSVIDSIISMYNYKHDPDAKDKYVVLDLETIDDANGNKTPYQITLIYVDKGDVNIISTYLNNYIFFDFDMVDGEEQYRPTLQAFYQQQKDIWGKEGLTEEEIDIKFKDLLKTVRSQKNNLDTITAFLHLQNIGCPIVAHNGIRFDFPIFSNFIHTFGERMLTNEYYHILSQRNISNLIHETQEEAPELSINQLKISEDYKKRLSVLIEQYKEECKYIGTSPRKAEILLDLGNEYANAIIESHIIETMFKVLSQRGIVTNYEEINARFKNPDSAYQKFILAVEQYITTTDVNTQTNLLNNMVEALTFSYKEMPLTYAETSYLRDTLKNLLANTYTIYNAYLNGTKDIDYSESYQSFERKLITDVYKQLGLSQDTTGTYNIKESLDRIQQQIINKQSIIETLQAADIDTTEELNQIDAQIKEYEEERKRLQAQLNDLLVTRKDNEADRLKLLKTMQTIADTLHERSHNRFQRVITTYNSNLTRIMEAEGVTATAATSIHSAEYDLKCRLYEQQKYTDLYGKALTAAIDLFKSNYGEDINKLSDEEWDKLFIEFLNNTTTQHIQLNNIKDIETEKQRLIAHDIYLSALLQNDTLDAAKIIEIYKDVQSQLKEYADSYIQIYKDNLLNIIKLSASEFKDDYDNLNIVKAINDSKWNVFKDELTKYWNPRSINLRTLLKMSKDLPMIRELEQLQTISIDEFNKLRSEKSKVLEQVIKQEQVRTKNTMEYLNKLEEQHLTDITKVPILDKIQLMHKSYVQTAYRTEESRSAVLQTRVTSMVTSGVARSDDMSEQGKRLFIQDAKTPLDSSDPIAAHLKKEYGINRVYPNARVGNDKWALELKEDRVFKDINYDSKLITFYVYDAEHESGHTAVYSINDDDTIKKDSLTINTTYCYNERGRELHKMKTKSRKFNNVTSFTKVMNNFYSKTNGYVPGLSPDKIYTGMALKDTSKASMEFLHRFVTAIEQSQTVSVSDFASRKFKEFTVVDQYRISLKDDLVKVNKTEQFNRKFYDLMTMLASVQHKQSYEQPSVVYEGMYNSLYAKYSALAPGKILTNIPSEYTIGYMIDFTYEDLEAYGISPYEASEGSAGKVFTLIDNYRLDPQYFADTSSVRNMLAQKVMGQTYTPIGYINEMFARQDFDNNKQSIENYFEPTPEYIDYKKKEWKSTKNSTDDYVNYKVEKLKKDAQYIMDKFAQKVNGKYINIFTPNAYSKNTMMEWEYGTAHEIGVNLQVGFINHPWALEDVILIDAEAGAILGYQEGNKVWISDYGFKGGIKYDKGLRDKYGVDIIANQTSVNERQSKGLIDEMALNTIRRYLLDSKDVDTKIKSILDPYKTELHKWFPEYDSNIQQDAYIKNGKLYTDQKADYKRMFNHLTNGKYDLVDLITASVDAPIDIDIWYKGKQQTFKAKVENFWKGELYVMMDAEHIASHMFTKAQIEDNGKISYVVEDTAGSTLKGGMISPTVMASAKQKAGKRFMEPLITPDMYRLLQSYTRMQVSGFLEFVVEAIEKTNYTDAIKLTDYITSQVFTVQDDDYNQVLTYEFPQHLKDNLYSFIVAYFKYLEDPENLYAKAQVDIINNKAKNEAAKQLSGGTGIAYRSFSKRYPAVRAQILADVRYAPGEIKLPEFAVKDLLKNDKNNTWAQVQTVNVEKRTQFNSTEELLAYIKELKAQGILETVQGTDINTNDQYSKYENYKIKNAVYEKVNGVDVLVYASGIEYKADELKAMSMYVMAVRSPVQDYNATPVLKVTGFHDHATADCNAFLYKMIGGDNDGDTAAFIKVDFKHVLKGGAWENLNASIYEGPKNFYDPGYIDKRYEELGLHNKNNVETFNANNEYTIDYAKLPDVYLKGMTLPYITMGKKTIAEKARGSFPHYTYFELLQTTFPDLIKDNLIKDEVVKKLNIKLINTLPTFTDAEVKFWYNVLVRHITKGGSYELENQIEKPYVYMSNNKYILCTEEEASSNNAKKVYDTIPYMQHFLNTQKDLLRKLYSYQQYFVELENKDALFRTIANLYPGKTALQIQNKFSHQALADTLKRILFSKLGINYMGNRRKYQVTASTISIFTNLNRDPSGRLWTKYYGITNPSKLTARALIEAFKNVTIKDEDKEAADYYEIKEFIENVKEKVEITKEELPKLHKVLKVSRDECHGTYVDLIQFLENSSKAKHPYVAQYIKSIKFMLDHGYYEDTTTIAAPDLEFIISLWFSKYRTKAMDFLRTSDEKKVQEKVKDYANNYLDQTIITRPTSKIINDMADEPIGMSKHGGIGMDLPTRMLAYIKRIGKMTEDNAIRKINVGNDEDAMLGFVMGMEADAINNRSIKYKEADYIKEQRSQQGVDLAQSYTTQREAINNLKAVYKQEFAHELTNNPFITQQDVDALYNNYLKLCELCANMTAFKYTLEHKQEDLLAVIKMFRDYNVPFYRIVNFAKDSVTLLTAVNAVWKNTTDNSRKYITLEQIYNSDKIERSIQGILELHYYKYSMAQRKYLEHYLSSISPQIYNFFFNISELDASFFNADGDEIEALNLVQTGPYKYRTTPLDVDAIYKATGIDYTEEEDIRSQKMNRGLLDKIKFERSEEGYNLANLLEELNNIASSLNHHNTSTHNQLEQYKKEIGNVNSKYKSIVDTLYARQYDYEYIKQEVENLAKYQNEHKQLQDADRGYQQRIRTIEIELNELDKKESILKDKHKFRETYNTQTTIKHLQEQIDELKEKQEQIKHKAMTNAFNEALKIKENDINYNNIITMLYSDRVNPIRTTLDEQEVMPKQHTLSSEEINNFKNSRVKMLDNMQSPFLIFAENFKVKQNDGTYKIDFNMMWNYYKQNSRFYRITVMVDAFEDETLAKGFLDYIRGASKNTKEVHEQIKDAMDTILQNAIVKDLPEFIFNDKKYNAIDPSVATADFVTPTLKEITVKSAKDLEEIYYYLLSEEGKDVPIGITNLNNVMEAMEKSYNVYKLQGAFHKVIRMVNKTQKLFMRLSAGFLVRNAVDTFNQLYSKMFQRRGLSGITVEAPRAVYYFSKATKVYDTYDNISKERLYTLGTIQLEYEDILRYLELPDLNIEQYEVVEKKVNYIVDKIKSYTDIAEVLTDAELTTRIKNRTPLAKELLQKMSSIKVLLNTYKQEQNFIQYKKTLLKSPLRAMITFLGNMRFNDYYIMYDNREVNGKTIYGLRMDADVIAKRKTVSQIQKIKNSFKTEQEYKEFYAMLKEVSAMMETQAQSDIYRETQYSDLDALLNVHKLRALNENAYYTYEEIKEQLKKGLAQESLWLARVTGAVSGKTLYDLANTRIENLARTVSFIYSRYVYGDTFEQSIDASLRSWFNYGQQSPYEQQLTFDMPYIAFPIRSIENWNDRMCNPRFHRLMDDIIDGMYGQYADEDGQYSDWEQFMIQSGWVPITNKLGIRLGAGVFDVQNMLSAPGEYVQQRRNPMLRALAELAESGDLKKAVSNLATVGLINRMSNVITKPNVITNALTGKTQKPKTIASSSSIFFEYNNYDTYKKYVPYKYRYSNNGRGRYVYYENLYKDWFTKYGRMRRPTTDPLQLVKNIQWKQYVRYKRYQYR